MVKTFSRTHSNGDLIFLFKGLKIHPEKKNRGFKDEKA
jgi:hypothetical protein